MKIVFAARNSVGGKYLSNLLSENGINFTLVIESGKVAKTRKLKRIFKKDSILLWPIKVVDIASVVIYSKVCEKWLNKNLLKPIKYEEYPNQTKKFYIDCINSKKSRKILNYLNPDVLLVYGTGLLKNDVIKKSKYYTLNIHGGAVPKYRNVHSDFWLLANKDYQNAGSSIIHLDEGADTGDIAIQETLPVDSNDDIFKLKKKLLILSGEILLKSINAAQKKKLSRTKQDNNLAKRYYTPTFIDFVKNIRKIF